MPHLPEFPIDDTTLSLPGPAGALEVCVESPEAGVPIRPVVAVVCHPLPTHGGSMHNKVVTMAARSLREVGITSVRFNFRGTGASTGVFDHGEGEVDDLRAVAAWVREGRPGHALWLAGFSFGAYVSLRAAADLAPGMLISIAPPVGRWQFAQIAIPTSPWLVIQGDEDEVVDATAVHAWLDRIDARAVRVRMPDAGHFFHRKLTDLREAIQQGVRPFLPDASAHGYA
ncbi:MAG: alpha/beta hydrolase [Lysobacteraceae bacterium]|nr:MAG: alpha/beta hydrolase [Xanthomonadaceae bacterium]